jgi:L-ascorbate metabolism protein UlaG (beta-lactamase superfamily)
MPLAGRVAQRQPPAALTWLGHSTVRFDLGSARLLTDPFLRRWVGPLRRVGPMPAATDYAAIDAVLISHLHHDHLDFRSLRRLGTATTIVAPRGSKALLSRHGFSTVHEVVAGDIVPIAGVTIMAVPAQHDGDRLGTRARAAPVGYLLRGAGRTVYFAGDTGVEQSFDAVPPGVDAAALPIGGWGLTLGRGHLDPRQAAELAARLRPRLVVPIHWGTLQLPVLRHLRPRLGQQAGPRFAALAAQLAAAVPAVLVAPGEVLALE